MTLQLTNKEHDYEVTLVADSISEEGQRISTFVLTYWRAIHGELMTHRLFSRNAMSSRAVPIEKMIEHINNRPAMPVHWGKNQPGMQANEEHDADVTIDLSWLMNASDYETDEPVNFSYTLPKKEAWHEAKRFAISAAKGFNDAGYHKQIVNRLTEPYQFMRTVVTATDFDNWYWLRDHSDAQPDIKLLASMMLELHNKSTPKTLDSTEWHTPFYKDGFWSSHYIDDDGVEFDRYNNTLETALKISSSCAAQASFRKADDSTEKAENVYQRLVESSPVHASPFEHPAKPIDDSEDGDWEEGVTHMDRNGNYWSGNFKGWVQYRQLIKNNACWDYEMLSTK
ncbi:MAG: hypothetical protein R3230_01000 [Nitrosopumilaceae archaeon]|nr:hypothetical protein [Nitrosopumilaceae archaeon]